MILPHVDEKLADRVFPKGIERVGMPSGKNYVRTTTNYWSEKNVNTTKQFYTKKRTLRRARAYFSNINNNKKKLT